jgi:hypothetical protein
MLLVGLKPALTDLAAENSPGAVLARDRKTFLMMSLMVGPLGGIAADIIIGLIVGPGHAGTGPGIGLVTGLLVGPAAAVVFYLVLNLRVGVMFGLVVGIIDWLIAWLLEQFVEGFATFVISGLLVGAVVGTLCGSQIAPWAKFTVTRCWLAIRRQLPWHLMDFLADARKRGVLRQAGASYQFRHDQFQQCLAARASPGIAGPVNALESSNQPDPLCRPPGLTES